MVSLLALFIGVVSGLRAMTAPAVVTWAASLGWLDLSGTWLAFLNSGWAVLILTIFAFLEIVNDKLPTTPSRKVPQQFAARLVAGALAGAAIGTPWGYWIAGLVSGVLGAVIGTYGGAWARGKLAEKFGKDLPAALIEDVVAVIGGLVLITLLPGAPTV